MQPLGYWSMNVVLRVLVTLCIFAVSKFSHAQVPIFWWNVAGCQSPNCPYPIQLEPQILASEISRLAPSNGIIVLSEFVPGQIPEAQLAALAGERDWTFVRYNSETPAGLLLIFPKDFYLVKGPALPWWPEHPSDRDGLEFESRWRTNFPEETKIWMRRFVMLRGPGLEVVPFHICQPWSPLMDGRGLLARANVARQILFGGANPHDYQLEAFQRELDREPVPPGMERVVVGDFNVPTHFVNLAGLRLLRPRLVRELRKRVPTLAKTETTFPHPASGWPERSMHLDQAYSTHARMTARVIEGRGSDHYPILVRPGTCSDNLVND